MKKQNKNAFIGMDAEAVFRDSLAKNPEQVEKIKEAFGIESDFLSAIGGGLNGKKTDVILGFDSGFNVEANVKSFKQTASFNQITRSSISNFCKQFELGDRVEGALTKAVLKKAKDRKSPLFEAKDTAKWEQVFAPIAKEMVKWGLSRTPNCEILVLFDRDESAFKVYRMKDVLRHMDGKVEFTKGGFRIGDWATFQRKGGDGNVTSVPKTELAHPSNNIQMKLRADRFMTFMDGNEIAEFEV